MREAMENKKLHINIKSKLFNTCILPVLSYGYQTWTLTKEIVSKLATYPYAMERSILNIKRKIENPYHQAYNRNLRLWRK